MLLAWFALALAETMYVQRPIDAARWVDAPGVSLKLEAGEEVEVLLRERERARVRRATEFGWVAIADLGPEAPLEGEVSPPIPVLPEG